MVARDFSSLTVGAEKNVDASHISLPVTASQILPEPQHQHDKPSPTCPVASRSQDRDEAEKSSRRTMIEGSQSPPGYPLPLIPSSPQLASPLGLVELCCLERTHGGVQGPGYPWHLQGDMTKTHTGTTDA